VKPGGAASREGRKQKLSCLKGENNTKEILQEAIDKGRKALSEYDSKRVVKSAGVATAGKFCTT